MERGEEESATTIVAGYVTLHSLVRGADCFLLLNTHQLVAERERESAVIPRLAPEHSSGKPSPIMNELNSTVCRAVASLMAQSAATAASFLMRIRT